MPKQDVPAPKEVNPEDLYQTRNVSLEPPTGDHAWSLWYQEPQDAFADFKSFEPEHAAGEGGLPSSGGSFRTLSARQISGQFEDEVAKSWEEDWEDEDVEDTFDHVMGQISRYTASKAAALGSASA